MRYYLVLLIILSLTSLICSSKEDGGTGTQGCIEGNCVNGVGKSVYMSGTYTGQFKDGAPLGEGVFLFTNGDRYEGYSENFKKEKYGTYHYHTGDRYVGEWKGDRRDGYGIYYYSSGDRYVGQWKDDVKKGEGVYHYANGSRHEGAFEMDKPHGKGVFSTRDGSVKKGYWVYGTYAGER